MTEENNRLLIPSTLRTQRSLERMTPPTEAEIAALERVLIEIAQADPNILMISARREAGAYLFHVQTGAPSFKLQKTEAQRAAISAATGSFGYNAIQVDTPATLTPLVTRTVYTSSRYRPRSLVEGMRDAFSAFPEVVAVVPGRGNSVTAVVRHATMRLSPEHMQALSTQAAGFKAVWQDPCEIQLAPEINFPPQALQDDDPDDEGMFKAELGQALMVDPGLTAAWVQIPHPFDAYEPKVARLWMLVDGPLDTSPFRGWSHAGIKVQEVQLVRSPLGVPREAACLVNYVSRLIAAQQTGNAVAYGRVQAAIRHEMSVRAAPKHASPGPNQVPLPHLRNLRGQKETYFVHCRWCREITHASENPNYTERCIACNALQAATTIPTKSKEMPLISLFANPDDSLYVELVFKAPEPHRWDLSKVVRYVIPSELAERFDQHPLGRRRPELWGGPPPRDDLAEDVVLTAQATRGAGLTPVAEAIASLLQTVPLPQDAARVPPENLLDEHLTGEHLVRRAAEDARADLIKHDARWEALLPANPQKDDET